jgi:Ca-activated chloride channel homolog
MSQRSPLSLSSLVSMFTGGRPAPAAPTSPYRTSEPELANDAAPVSNRGVLPLVECGLSVDACGGYARAVLRQRFENQHDEPLTVEYKLPLPADAAVSGFAFQVGDRVIRGVVKGRSDARREYEEALVEGRSAALLEQERSSLFTQEIGNIPPRTAVEVEITLDQPLAWLVEGSWEWRFPLAAAPRYLGNLGYGEGARVSARVAIEGIGARASLSMKVRDALTRSPESPSHPLTCANLGRGGWSVELGSGNRVALDRDVVVRWNAATATPGLSVDQARGVGPDGELGCFGLVTLVPEVEPTARPRAVPRDLILLLDTSGSMSGEPLEQEKRIACALVDSLGETDRLEIVEFSSRPRGFKSEPQAVTPALKREAFAWIRGLVASGGTEMVSGVEHAMRALRPGSQRQIVLITDGLVGFEQQLVTTVLAGLPDTARLHCVGVGSAVNRSLVAPIARAGRGVEAIVGLGEDPERTAQRVIARTAEPRVVDVAIEGSALRRVVPSRLPDVYEGAPLRAAVELHPEGGTLRIRGRMFGGAFVRELQIAPSTHAREDASIPKLFARELVEDLEMRISSGEERVRLEAEIEQAAKGAQISSRLTSWIAVTERATVDPRDPTRRVVQPHALAHGLSAEGLGLRSAAEPSFGAPASMSAESVAGPMREQAFADAPSQTMAGTISPKQKKEFERSMKRAAMGAPPPAAPPPAPARSAMAPPRSAAPGAAPKPIAPRSPAPQPAAPSGPARRQESEEKAEGSFDRDEERALGGAISDASFTSGHAAIRHVGDRLLVVEVSFDREAPLTLLHAAVWAKLRHRDGRVLPLRLVPEQTSHEGAFAVGVVYRLVFALDDALSREEVVAVDLDLGGLFLEAK